MNQITVSVTVRELLDRGSWDKACAIKHFNPWIVNEGLMDSSERLEFNLEQACELGLALPHPSGEDA